VTSRHRRRPGCDIEACQTPEILGDPSAALAWIRRHAATTRADLLVCPEGFLQGYLTTASHVRDYALDLRGRGFAAVREGLADLRPMLVVGVLERRGDRYYNTAVVLRRGSLVGAYRKTHLTAGESVFTPGRHYPVFTCRGVRFGINICYDTRFPAAARAVASRGARVLVVPAQNMMRRPSALSWQPRHNEIRARRARETGMWLISADVTGTRGESHVGLGPTSVIAPSGSVLAEVPPGEIGTVTARIPLPRRAAAGSRRRA
jgi:predicted amidohydrolase